jgi:hypothetical protein
LTSPATPRTGGQLIVDMLAENGVERVFTVPGESFLAVLDALRDSAIAGRVPPTPPPACISRGRIRRR